MPAERVAMRVVRKVLHLTFAGISKREVARRTGLASSTVRATIARFQSLGLTWPLPETVTDSVGEGSDRDASYLACFLTRRGSSHRS